MPQSRSTAFPGASKEEEMGKYSEKNECIIRAYVTTEARTKKNRGTALERCIENKNTGGGYLKPVLLSRNFANSRWYSHISRTSGIAKKILHGAFEGPRRKDKKTTSRTFRKL